MTKTAVMKTIRVEEAVGSVLCHDITRIVPGKSKGPVFRKGHVVRAEDIPLLLDVGKEHLYVFEPAPGSVHEDDAARRIAAVTVGANIRLSEPREGRITFFAAVKGLLKVDAPTLARMNGIGEITMATLHTMQMVEQGQDVAGTRVIPLLIAEGKLRRVETLVRAPIIDVLPLRSARVGIVTTGSEIFHGRIEDAFGPVLRKKFSELGSEILGQKLTGDDIAVTARAIDDFIRSGADMVVVTGGMSVDPDDRTPAAIRAAGAKVVRYGAPVYPGAMFLLGLVTAERGEVPVLGLPGCVMYHKASIFELLVPRLLAGLAVTEKDIIALGHGGFCAYCAECRYPVCHFGKS
ncbi:MAG: molybdopterin-binding protein [Desulfovibrio sp.]|nr:molybdopterin-binding protein [Desulfovibrio sp.]